MFDKSESLFPIKKQYRFLSHCSVSPLYAPAFNRECEVAKEQQNVGALLFAEGYGAILEELRTASAELLKTEADNMAFVKNTSEGMSLLANGYRFSPGDQVIGYSGEYPANFYPWLLQERRGVEFLQLPNRNENGDSSKLPIRWTIDDLKKLVTDRTRILAVSHVQFTSGYAVNLAELGDFCGKRNIDLVVDAAQSLGSLPVLPEQWNISAVASSGWKWLLGPIGTGLLYTSANLRNRLDHVMVGAGLMHQGEDYLDHSWKPLSTAKRFEYSTSPPSLAAALATCIKELPLRYSVETIKAELFRLQDILLQNLDRERYKTLAIPDAHRSGIMAIICKNKSAEKVVQALAQKHIICSARGGFLRIAPHFCNTDEDLVKTTHVLNSL